MFKLQSMCVVKRFQFSEPLPGISWFPVSIQFPVKILLYIWFGGIQNIFEEVLSFSFSLFQYLGEIDIVSLSVIKCSVWNVIFDKSFIYCLNNTHSV